LSNATKKFPNNIIYVDGILSFLISSKKTKGYEIQTTKRVGYVDIEYIAEKDGIFAHGNSVKKAISDLEFKILSEQIKKEPITLDMVMTVQKYRIITGACDSGVRGWMEQKGLPYTINDDGNTVESKPIKVSELLPILGGAYGSDRIKSLLKS
jgi:hypothetical protein